MVGPLSGVVDCDDAVGRNVPLSVFPCTSLVGGKTGLAFAPQFLDAGWVLLELGMVVSLRGFSFKHNVLLLVYIFLGAGCLGDQVGVLSPSPLVMTRCMLRLGKTGRSIQLVHKKEPRLAIVWLLGVCAAVGARVKLWDISGLGIACVTWVDTWNST